MNPLPKKCKKARILLAQGFPIKFRANLLICDWSELTVANSTLIGPSKRRNPSVNPTTRKLQKANKTFRQKNSIQISRGFPELWLVLCLSQRIHPKSWSLIGQPCVTQNPPSEKCEKQTRPAEEFCRRFPFKFRADCLASDWSKVPNPKTLSFDWSWKPIYRYAVEMNLPHTHTAGGLHTLFFACACLKFEVMYLWIGLTNTFEI